MNLIASTIAAIILATASVAPAHAVGPQHRHSDNDRVVCETYAVAVVYIAALQQNGYSAEQVRSFTELPDVIHPDWTDLILDNIDAVYRHAPPPLPEPQREVFLIQFERNYIASCLAARGR